MNELDTIYIRSGDSLTKKFDICSKEDLTIINDLTDYSLKMYIVDEKKNILFEYDATASNGMFVVNIPYMDTKTMKEGKYYWMTVITHRENYKSVDCGNFIVGWGMKEVGI